MKQLMISLSFMVVSFFGLANGNEGFIPTTVISDFKTQFPGAENIKWNQVDKFTVATFTYEEKQLTAYYYGDGSLAVVAEVISKSDLPKGLRKDLDTHTSAAELMAVYKLETDIDTRYYSIVQAEGKKQILVSLGNKWSVVNTKK